MARDRSEQGFYKKNSDLETKLRLSRHASSRLKFQELVKKLKAIEASVSTIDHPNVNKRVDTIVRSANVKIVVKGKIKRPKVVAVQKIKQIESVFEDTVEKMRRKKIENALKSRERWIEHIRKKSEIIQIESVKRENINLELPVAL